MLHHSNFGVSHCILFIIISVDYVLYLSSWKLLLILCSFILDIFSSFFPPVGLQFSSFPFNMLFCFSNDSIVHCYYYILHLIFRSALLVHKYDLFSSTLFCFPLHSSICVFAFSSLFSLISF